MIFSSTTEYALRVLAIMANSDKHVFSARFLIEQTGMPDKYLRTIMTKLTKAKIILSIRGREGGYVFAKEPSNISLFSVVRIFEDTHKYYKCILGFEQCQDNNPCALHPKWYPIRNQILNFLQTTTIADTIQKTKGKIKF